MAMCKNVCYFELYCKYQAYEVSFAFQNLMLYVLFSFKFYEIASADDEGENFAKGMDDWHSQ